MCIPIITKVSITIKFISYDQKLSLFVYTYTLPSNSQTNYIKDEK